MLMCVQFTVRVYTISGTNGRSRRVGVSHPCHLCYAYVVCSSATRPALNDVVAETQNAAIGMAGSPRQDRATFFCFIRNNTGAQRSRAYRKALDEDLAATFNFDIVRMQDYREQSRHPARLRFTLDSLHHHHHPPGSCSVVRGRHQPFMTV